MAHITPYLPPEIILMIISTPNINLASLLHCTRVSKEWHSFIYDSNTLRTKLFLPQRSKSGALVNVEDPRSMAHTWVSVIMDSNPKERLPSTKIMAEPPLEDVSVHPLLLQHRVESIGHFEDDVFTLSYRLLRELHNLKKRGVTSWQKMCVTEPPLSCIRIWVQRVKCDELEEGGTVKTLRNSCGVTLQNLFDAMWNTYLSRNLALVVDDGSCQGRPWDADSEPYCLCYDHIAKQEQAYAEVELAEENLQAARRNLEARGEAYLKALRDLKDLEAGGNEAGEE